MKEADKEAMKEGAKTCWNSFKTFVDRFTELIFIFTMLGAGVYTIIFDLIPSPGVESGTDKPKEKHSFEMII